MRNKTQNRNFEANLTHPYYLHYLLVRCQGGKINPWFWLVQIWLLTHRCDYTVNCCTWRFETKPSYTVLYKALDGFKTQENNHTSTHKWNAWFVLFTWHQTNLTDTHWCRSLITFVWFHMREGSLKGETGYTDSWELTRRPTNISVWLCSLFLP